MDFIVGAGIRIGTQKLSSSRHLLEVDTLAVRHVLFNEAARVGDLLLFADVAILYGHPQSVLVSLNKTTDSRDMEHIWIRSSSKVVGENRLFG